MVGETLKAPIIILGTLKLKRGRTILDKLHTEDMQGILHSQMVNKQHRAILVLLIPEEIKSGRNLNFHSHTYPKLVVATGKRVP